MQHDHRPTTTVGRRAVIASAWAAPVVVTAAAAPAAVASTVPGFDVALDPPQLGDSVIMFNADYTHPYRMDVPMAWVVANHGTKEAPGGFPFSVTYDNRVWAITGFRGRFNGDDTGEPINLPDFSTSTSGHATTATATVPVAIPPGTDSYSGFFVSVTGRSFKGEYPNDGIDAPTPRTWAVVPPKGDADASDDTVKFQSYTDLGAMDVWGIVVDATWEYASWSDGARLRRPSSSRFTSVGPTATPDGCEVHVSTDSRMSSGLELTNVTVNGQASDILTRTDEWDSGSDLGVTYALGAGLQKDDVLAYDVRYTDREPVPEPSDVNAGQTNMWDAADPNNHLEQRAVGRSSIDHAPS